MQDSMKIKQYRTNVVYIICTIDYIKCELASKSTVQMMLKIS